MFLGDAVISSRSPGRPRSGLIAALALVMSYLAVGQAPASAAPVCGTQRATPYGYSLWEMEVYGT
jgi:hypothetical protein